MRQQPHQNRPYRRTDAELRNEVGVLTPKLEKVIHTLEWVRVEEFVGSV